MDTWDIRNRSPNGTLIRESFKMVSRVANLAAKNDNTKLFNGEEGI